MPTYEFSSSIENMRLAIIGAGVIGLSCAFEAAKRGAKVTIFDADVPGRGASWAAAGMLAPSFEAGMEVDSHPGLLELCFESAALWPEYAVEIESRSGRQIGYHSGPSLALARDANDEKILRCIEQRLSLANKPYDRLTKEDLYQFEPNLAGGFTGGLRLALDGAVDNRRLIEALLVICDADPMIEVRSQTRISEPSSLLPEHDVVICTAGWQSRSLMISASDIRPVAGQLLSVETYDQAPKYTIRFGATYIAPKQDRIIIGATVEPGETLKQPDQAVIDDLLQMAAAVCPDIEKAARLESWAGIRPGTPDNAPLLGETDQDGIYVATGHFRNGILLAPITARKVVDMITSGESAARRNPFSPERFMSAVR